MHTGRRAIAHPSHCRRSPRVGRSWHGRESGPATKRTAPDPGVRSGAVLPGHEHRHAPRIGPFPDTLAEGWRIGVAQEDSRPATVDAEAGGADDPDSSPCVLCGAGSTPTLGKPTGSAPLAFEPDPPRDTECAAPGRPEGPQPGALGSRRQSSSRCGTVPQRGTAKPAPTHERDRCRGCRRAKSQFAGAAGRRAGTLGTVQQEDAAQWWASIRQGWGYTPATEESELCTRCGRVVRSEAVELLEHHDWHRARERHPSAR